MQALVLPVAIAVALALPVRAENAKLQWGKEHSAAGKATTQSTSLKFVKPNVAKAADADVAAEASSSAPVSGASISNVRNTDLGVNRIAKRSINTSINTSADTNGIIRLVAYETNDAPRLTSGRETEAETRSVVVNRDGESADGFRSAQVPVVKPGSNAVKDPSGRGNSGVEDGLRSPFVDNPAEPPQPNPLPIPENNAAQTLPAPEANPSGQPAQQPNQKPPVTPPPAGQLQPVLPSGPTQPEQTNSPEPATNDAMLKSEGAKAQESCEKSIENLRAYTVDKVNLNISVAGTAGKDFPFECSIDNGTMHAGRCWEQTTYMWKASAMCHKPLYFEDEQLERYGHSFTPCLQPFVSGAHFFTRLPVLPYCMGVEPPQECIYALGHYRPGSCAPYMCNPIPLSLRGALFEAGAVVGTAAVLP